jgi:hypothetical protein
VDSGSQSVREAKPKEQPNSEFDNANLSTTGASSNQNVQTTRPVERFARSQTQTGPNMPKNVIERTPPATKHTSNSVRRMRYSKICKIDRNESETILSTQANPQDYILRESTTKVGSYAFSVLSEDGIHHFPIAATADGKYYIGQYNFDTLDDVVAYYKIHPLFTNAYGNDVMLGTQFEMQ